MSFPASGCLNLVQTILNMTAAQASAAVAAKTNPTGNNYGIVGVNSGASGSLVGVAGALYGPVQGQNGNKSARNDVVIPKELANQQSAIFTQVNYTYRM